MDAQQKALGGDVCNKGQEWPPRGTPEDVWTQACPDPQLGKAMP